MVLGAAALGHEGSIADLFGFSTDAVGRVRVAEAFSQVKSVDLIVEPGAGGQVIDLIKLSTRTPT